MSDVSTDDNADDSNDHEGAADGAADEKKRDKDLAKAQFQVAFAERLNLELDAIGFVKGRRRSGALAEQFEVDRSNGYRILKGIGYPDALYQTKLRQLGVSVDRILDHIGQHVPTTYTVFIGGKMVAATVLKGVDGNDCSAALLPKDGGYELIAMSPGEAVPDGAIPILSIHFIDKPTLAIVEDDIQTLDRLAYQMWDSFRPMKFESAHALVEALKAPNNFKAVLMDWRLPDMDGEELVKKIRAYTKAPICILTADVTASKAIARAFSTGNVDHVTKPADPEILAARIQMAIKNSEL